MTRNQKLSFRQVGGTSTPKYTYISNIRIFQIYVYFNSNRGVFEIYVYLKYTLHAWVYSNEGVDMWYDYQGASLAIRDMNRVIR